MFWKVEIPEKLRRGHTFLNYATLFFFTGAIIFAYQAAILNNNIEFLFQYFCGAFHLGHFFNNRAKYKKEQIFHLLNSYSKEVYIGENNVLEI